MKYDGHMNKQCIALCNTLNELSGTETIESCCGHCIKNYMIFFKCNNVYSLSIIARAFDRRYSGTHKVYDIKLLTKDDGIPKFCYIIESQKPYDTIKEMEEDMNQLITDINYWSQDKFKKHFMEGLASYE